MLKIETMIKRIRRRLHDTEQLVYDDEEILDAINMGLRQIRRTIADIRPSLLITKREGILKEGEESVELSKRPLKVVHVTVGERIVKRETKYDSVATYQNTSPSWKNPQRGYTKQEIKTYSERGLEQTELAQVIGERSDEKGEPRSFYVTGERTIQFYPKPRGETKYSVLTVDDIEELEREDKSPLPTEFDDFVIEYATIRLSVGNEYDMADEAQLLSGINEQISRLLRPPPSGVTVKGYWR